MMLTLELDSDQHVIGARIVCRSAPQLCPERRVVIDSRSILIPPSPPPLAAAAPFLFPALKRTAYK